MQSITWTYIKEKWAHAGFQRYFQNIGWSFAGRFFSLLVSFFIGALVARYLGPQRYGDLNYALSFVGLFIFLASFGVDNILIRELLKYKDKEESLINTTFVLKFIGGLTIIILATLSSILIKNDAYITLLIFIYSLHLIFISLNVTDTYFQSAIKLKYSFVAQFISTVCVSILKLYFVFAGFGTGWFIVALIFETALSSIIMLNFFYKSGHALKPHFDAKLAKKLMRDSWPFILTSAFYLMYTKIDQVMIGKMIDTTSLGMYSAGVKLAELWSFIPSVICGVMFPAVMNSKLVSDELYRNRLKKIFTFILSISFIFALLEFIFAKYIVLLIFGSAFTGSVIVLKVYTWAGVIVSCIIIIHQYLIIEDKTKLIVISSLVGATANILLNLILIPKYNIIGSAWATIISYSFIPITVVVMLKYNSNKQEK